MHAPHGMLALQDSKWLGLIWVGDIQCLHLHSSKQLRNLGPWQMPLAGAACSMQPLSLGLLHSEQLVISTLPHCQHFEHDSHSEVTMYPMAALQVQKS